MSDTNEDALKGMDAKEKLLIKISIQLDNMSTDFKELRASVEVMKLEQNKNEREVLEHRLALVQGNDRFKHIEDKLAKMIVEQADIKQSFHEKVAAIELSLGKLVAYLSGAGVVGGALGAVAKAVWDKHVGG